MHYKREAEELQGELALSQVLAALEDEGDTGEEQSGQEDGGDAPDAAGDKAQSESEGENAVVLARDGRHTIPYEKLQEARQGWQQANAQV